jgi:hypothetical protein
MPIASDTTIAQLLDEHPCLLDFLAGYHPHFERLRNGLVRRVMAPRVTVAEAARMVGVPAAELLAALCRAAGQPDAGPRTVAPVELGTTGVPRPGELEAVAAARLVHLDVRGDIRSGAVPLPRIMNFVKALGPGEVLVLRTLYEPIPLYSILAKRGLAHWTERQEPEDWLVWFYRPLPHDGPDRGASDILPGAATGGE